RPDSVATGGRSIMRARMASTSALAGPEHAPPWRRLACVAACMLAAALVGSVPAAHADKAWTVHEKLLGEARAPDYTDAKKSRDVSGLACATSGFPRLCLVVDDDSQGAQIVILDDGELLAGDFIRLIHDTYLGELLELDAEGVAYADGFFYVIGSHGRPRHEQNFTEEETRARAEATRRLFRIRFATDVSGPKAGKLSLAAEIRSSGELTRFIKAQPDLQPSFDRPLDDNGLTIEGVAVRDGRLHVGMRGPVLGDGDAAILSVP